MTTQVLPLPASTATAGDYFALLKPRVMSLVVFTAGVGMLLALQQATLPLTSTLISLLCIALGGGASGALNMWYERELDGRMSRTRTRPLPMGKITPDDALLLGLFSAAVAVAFLGLASNWLAASLLAFTIFFYAIVYTVWLKPRTPQNIVIGGASGALPPVVAWAAVTGEVTSLQPWLLFLLIFLWTPPHFWALSLYRCKDYAAAGIPMLPNVKGEAHTKYQIVLYTVLVVGVSLAWPAAGYGSWLYTAVAVVLGAGFLRHANRLLLASANQRDARAKALFFYSIFYLFALFLIMIPDSLLF